ncbi:MAG: hypothetical protein J6X20_07135, partial [Bacteroidales bacterium]|nr:hypothetical protein [Bacteroidales bacterium]
LDLFLTQLRTLGQRLKIHVLEFTQSFNLTAYSGLFVHKSKIKKRAKIRTFQRNPTSRPVLFAFFIFFA